VLNQLKTSYTVVPGRPDLNAYEIYSVNRVVGQPGAWLERPIEYQPFYSQRPGSSNSPKKEAYWFASRRKSLRKGDEGIEVELSFVDPNFSPMVPAVQKINIQITCTNRDLPVSGIKGDFEVEAIGSAVSRARLLVDPTPTGRPPLGRSAQWAAIMHLGLNYLSLIDSPEGPLALRELLTVYDFRRTEVTQKMINSIIGVTCEQIAGRTGNRVGNTVCLGTKVMVLIDEEIHSGSGAFLTVSVLERFLGAYVTINSFTQMVARSKQRGAIWKRWPSRCGDRTLL
jgi:type VI secretion system protein ImpG